MDHRKVMVDFFTEIEKVEGVKFLHLGIVGSRMTGLMESSSKSDYDVRGVYVKPLDFYLQTLELSKEAQEIRKKRSADETCPEIDFVGFELRKALRLIQKSNPTVVELFCCGNYLLMNKDLQRISLERVNYQTIGCQYYSASMSNWRSFIEHQQLVKRKKYLYIIYNLARCNYALKKKGLPSMKFHDVVFEEESFELSPHLKLIIRELVERKLKGDAWKSEERISELDQWIQEKRVEFKNLVQSKNAILRKDFEELDQVLRKNVKYYEQLPHIANSLLEELSQ